MQLSDIKERLCCVEDKEDVLMEEEKEMKEEIVETPIKHIHHNLVRILD